MDENQITDRPERDRPETGMRRNAAFPRLPPLPRRRAAESGAGGCRSPSWCFWAGRSASSGGPPRACRPGHPHPGHQSGLPAIVLLLALWYIFFTGLWWRTRLLLGGIGLLLIVGFFAALRFNGATGDMGFRYTCAGRRRPTPPWPVSPMTSSFNGRWP